MRVILSSLFVHALYLYRHFLVLQVFFCTLGCRVVHKLGCLDPRQVDRALTSSMKPVALLIDPYIQPSLLLHG